MLEYKSIHVACACTWRWTGCGTWCWRVSSAWRRLARVAAAGTTTTRSWAAWRSSRTPRTSRWTTRSPPPSSTSASAAHSLAHRQRHRKTHSAHPLLLLYHVARCIYSTSSCYSTVYARTVLLLQLHRIWLSRSELVSHVLFNLRAFVAFIYSRGIRKVSGLFKFLGK